MQASKLKNMAWLLNYFVLGIIAIEHILAFVQGDTKRYDISGMWYVFTGALFVFNYFVLTPYIFKESFSPLKLLKLFVIFMGLHYSLSFIWGYVVTLYYVGGEFQPEFTYFWIRFSVSFFYFMLSTSTRVVKMFNDNQLKIQDLKQEQQLNELKTIQSGVNSELVSKYIEYLQDKLKRNESIAEELVELADFLRYTTYSSMMKKASLHSEVEQLKRYVTILSKSHVTNVVLTGDVEDRTLVPTFSLLTPLKELLFKHPTLSSINVSIVKMNSGIELCMLPQNTFEARNDYQSFDLIVEPGKEYFKSSIQL